MRIILQAIGKLIGLLVSKGVLTSTEAVWIVEPLYKLEEADNDK